MIIDDQASAVGREWLVDLDRNIEAIDRSERPFPGLLVGQGRDRGHLASAKDFKPVWPKDSSPNGTARSRIDRESLAWLGHEAKAKGNNSGN